MIVKTSYCVSRVTDTGGGGGREIFQPRSSKQIERLRISPVISPQVSVRTAKPIGLTEEGYWVYVQFKNMLPR